MSDSPTGRGWARLRLRAGALVGALRIYHHAAPVAGYLRLAVAVVAGLAPVAAAWVTKGLLDGLASDPVDRARLALLAGVLAGVGAVGAVLQHVARYLDQEVTRRVGLFTQAQLFATVVRAPGLADLEDPAYHDRVQLARQSSQSGPVLLTTTGLAIAQSLVTVAGFVCSLAALSPLAALLVLGSVAPALAAQLRLSRLRSDAVRGNSPHIRRQLFYSSLLLDLRAAKEIRLFGLGDHFRERMLTELGGIQRAERRVDRATARMDTALSVLTALVSGVVLVVTVLRLAGGHGRVGDLVVLISALAALQVTVAGIVAQIATVDTALALFEHYLAIVSPRSDPGAPVRAATRPAARAELPEELPAELRAELPAELPADRAAGSGSVAARMPAPAPVPARSGGLGDGPVRGIRFEDVWFRYSDDQPWVLRGIDLELPPGRTVALVGLNGAGKSTVVKLLCRLYEPSRGRITWDGVDIAGCATDALRARIATVFQDFVCYELSAHDNIALGALARSAQPEAVPTAAARAGVHEVLAGLPHGYATMLTRTFAGVELPDPRRRPTPAQPAPATAGVLLSGGQWQRVALARALLRTGADLLILDEPSSGLDARAEAEIHRALREVRAGRTSLLISHRLNTIRGADRIAVVAGGRVAEQGDHRALLAAGGTYAELFRLQAEGYRDGDGPAGDARCTGRLDTVAANDGGQA